MKWIAAVLLTLVGAVTPAIAQSAERPGSLSLAVPEASELAQQRTLNSLRLAAKLLCSGVFLSDRKAERVIDEDLHWAEYNFFDWQSVDWLVDQETGVVTLSMPAPNNADHVWAAEALFEPGYGCTLLPDQATRLPVERSARTISGTNDILSTDTSDANERLEQAVSEAFEETPELALQRTRAIVVVKDGQIIAERYADGFDENTSFLGWSMGKSLAALLFGAYVHQFGTDIDAPVELSEWGGHGDPRREITPRHLLNMAGGLKFHNPGSGDSLYYSDLHDHESVYFRSQNIEQLVVNQPLASVPGTHFAYRNTNTLSLMVIMRRGLGEDCYLTFSDDAVFSKIGADSMVLETDPFGNPIITGFVYGTARDWARLGQLALNDGVVAGERILPQGWRDEVLLNPSATNASYGGQVWLNTGGRFQHAPKDAGYFLGWGDQVVMILPTQNMVIVRLGLSDGDFTEYFDGVLEKILAAIEQ
ncbi:MAG: serine hydrolase [Pseudomonadota bacterium]